MYIKGVKCLFIKIYIIDLISYFYNKQQYEQQIGPCVKAQSIRKQVLLDRARLRQARL